MQLQFRSRLAVPLFTGGKIEGEQGAAIHVVLLDVTTGHVLTVGPEASAKLDVVVLDGDFNNEDDEGWSGEEFEGHLVKERQGKRPLLTGDVQVTLKEGVGTLGELIFTDNSSWIRCRKFRLGLKVSSGYCEGMRVREAKTEAFTVKDHRGECEFLLSFSRFLSYDLEVVVDESLSYGVTFKASLRLPNGSFLQCTRNIIRLLWMMRSGGWKRLEKMGLSIRN